MRPLKTARPSEAKWVLFYAGLEDVRELWRFLRYLWIRGLLGVFRRLPTRLAGGLGSFLGGLAYWTLTPYRKRTIENLGRAFPEADGAWIKSISRNSFIHLGSNVAYAAKLSRMTENELAAAPVVRGGENLAEALKGGGGVVIVSAHLGCWELLPAYLAARGLKVSIVTERLAGRSEDELLRAERLKLGVGQVGEGVARLKETIRELRTGAVVCCPYDQDAGRAGYFVSFFGRRAFVPSLPLKMAQLAKTPVLLAYACREGAFHVLTFEAPVEVRADQAMARLAGDLVERVEGWIRLRPEQWPWMHRRWRRSPHVDQMSRGA